MIINNLTLKNLYKKEQANPTGKRFEITYGGGLGLRVSKKGKFTWQCRYRFGGKQHRLDIGRYPELSISEAVNELESILISGQYILDLFCTKVRRILPWDCKITIFVIQILRILILRSNKKKIVRNFYRFGEVRAFADCNN